jgi:phosphoglycerate dehydrogenase-like enzyme
MQRAHVWRGLPNYGDRRGLWGKTIGVVGLGSTGAEIATLAKAFGMTVLGYRRDPDPYFPSVDQVYSAARPGDLHQLLRRSDVVVLSIRMTDETYHLIGERELSIMKPSAYLVNVSRGPVVDTGALITALRSGAIAGAGLDVFEQEPLPADAEIWDAPNVVITPHVTAEVPDLASRSLDIIEQNVRRYRAGEPMLNQLVPTDVYTKPPINRPEPARASGGV